MSAPDDEMAETRHARTEEDKVILERISEISGRINRFKNATMQEANAKSLGVQPWNKYVAGSPQPKDASWRSPRLSPYATGAGRARRTTTHRNRSLILNKGSQSKNETPPSTDEDSVNPESASPRFVSKRDRHMQLINTNVYDKETQARNKAMEETRHQRALKKDQREQQKMARFLQRAANANAPAHKLTVEGVNFGVLNGGSKLVRLGESASTDIYKAGPCSRDTGDKEESKTPTPKQAVIGGVTFHRSKNGNLYRSGVVRAKRDKGGPVKVDKPCKQFTSTGRCSRGPRCPYIHDASKVAMCRDFLQTGTCPAGDACDLSHEATPERVPACLHFLRGHCANPACRYAHVRVDPGAAVCKDFAVLGFCARGEACPERHVHECPEYANSGVCRKRKCHLPHVDRAGRMREEAKRRGVLSSAELKEGDEESENEEEDSDEYDQDMDSDGLEEIMGHDSVSLAGQDDFVKLS